MDCYCGTYAVCSPEALPEGGTDSSGRTVAVADYVQWRYEKFISESQTVQCGYYF